MMNIKILKIKLLKQIYRRQTYYNIGIRVKFYSTIGSFRSYIIFDNTGRLLSATANHYRPIILERFNDIILNQVYDAILI